MAWNVGPHRPDAWPLRQREWRRLLALPSIMAVALLLRLQLLDHSSLSLDEAFTRYWIEQGQAFLWGEGRRIETNPPLYYSLLHIWSAIAGGGDSALRLPSALASVALVGMAGWLGRQVAGPAAGLGAAALLAVWPLCVWHGVEARPVALAPLFEAAALLGVFLWVRRVAGAPVHGGRGARPLAAPFALVVLGSVAAIHTHATALFFTAALGAALAGALLSRRAARLADLAPAAAAGAVIAAISGPQFLVFVAQRNSGNIAWIPPLSVWKVQSFAIPLGPGMAMFELPGWLRVALLALLLGLAAIGAARLRDRAAITVLLAVPMLYVAALLAASLGRPVLLPRVAVILLLPMAVLVAMGILARPGLAWRAGTGALAAGVLALGLGMQLYRPASATFANTLRPDYRAVVRFLQDEARCAGPVFTGHAWTLLGWPHYAPAERRPLMVVQLPEEEDFRRNPFFALHAPRSGITFLSAAEFGRMVESLPASVILVQRTPASSPPMRAQIAAWEARFAVERHAFGQGNNEIVVHCLRAPNPGRSGGGQSRAWTFT
ncbi:hypothetical protein DFH01_26410 [Falsiroseomonas bella]|uniref:Glycosyltransferase RgtA/B/C/D-like domain-containing protein n=2 Tax=Falsiroseomonas bella TaxID=2184016 RepID=A0A317F4U2_9PROT|nr:glycosyltransferase family 39 protein [Falsiroseomonas bella]PWS34164.1 hypothetical protein DFH01_26410 [Falsiroseomonas bella]